MAGLGCAAFAEACGGRSMEAQADRKAGMAALATYIGVLLSVAVLVQIDVNLPGIGHLGSALVALLFLYAPGIADAWLRTAGGEFRLRDVWAAWRRGDPLDAYGFRAAPVRRGLVIAAASIAVIAPVFAVGYVAFYGIACGSPHLVHFVPRNLCAHFGAAAHLPDVVTREFGEFCLIQLVVVALPEELFFRGFLLQLLERRFPPKRRILGGGIGVALVLSAAAFALIHIPKDGDPRALATFFPALLFGWMRSATGSILASTVTHGAANILVRVLELSYLR